jgi:hypothetical protein
MDNLMSIAFELKDKLSDKEYLDLNESIMQVYKTKAIIIKENGSMVLSLEKQTEIYNQTSEDLAEWEIADIDIEQDETLL